MNKLNPTAQLVRAALTDGPATTDELAARIERSRPTTGKALTELVKAGLVSKTDAVDADSGAVTRWSLTGTPDGDTAANTDAPSEAGDETDPEASHDESPAEPAGTAPADAAPDDTPAVDSPPATADQKLDTPDSTEPGGDASEQAPPKRCRGCQNIMPTTCETCWQKTPSCCGQCRRTMPATRRREPGEPVILANGLPKLRQGELQALVLEVMRSQPLPTFAGITGWTPGRVAIHLPGRSNGAILNAMRKLAAGDTATVIGEQPERYQLTPADDDTDTDGQHAQEPTAPPDTLDD